MTLRVRLSLVYAAAFGAAGLVLVVVMYLLVRARLAPAGRTVVSLRTAPSAGGAASPLPEPGSVTEVQQAIDTYNSGTLTNLLQYSLLAVLVLLLLAVAAGWLIAGRTLRPLQEITATARRVADDRGLHQRIALAGPPDELKELADTFDAMLERLDRAFTGQRRFVADASHELRTPLAITRTVLEVALGDPETSAETRRLGRTLLATNERSERLIDGLLTLASSGAEPARRPLDLSDVAARATEQVAGEAAEHGVALGSVLAPAPAAGDGLLLERLALNLVQNGVRHNAPGGRVDVVTGTWADGPELVVTNTGPVVPPYELEALFEPFRRLSAERTGSDRGVGLGLAIVRSVAQAHGGTVTATPRPGGGLVVRVVLPG